MKSLFLALSLTVLIEVIPLVCGNEDKEKTLVLGTLSSQVRVADPADLCRFCFRGRRGVTRTFIRSKGCPENHMIRKCNINITADHAVGGLRCACRESARTPATRVQCGRVQRSIRGFTAFSVRLGRTSGTFTLRYRFFGSPDRLEVFYERNLIFTTDGFVSGQRNVSIDYMGTSPSVGVRVTPQTAGSAWEFLVSCPEG